MPLALQPGFFPIVRSRRWTMHSVHASIRRSWRWSCWSATASWKPWLRPGLDDSYRNGFSRIRVHFNVKGNAPQEKLQELVDRAQQRSAVFDMVTNGVPVEVTATLG